MRNEERLKILRWFVKMRCPNDSIQTDVLTTDNVREIELMLMNSKDVWNPDLCSRCAHEDKINYKKCNDCDDEGSNFTFPYGHYKKFYERDTQT